MSYITTSKELGGYKPQPSSLARYLEPIGSGGEIVTTLGFPHVADMHTAITNQFPGV